MSTYDEGFGHGVSTVFFFVFIALLIVVCTVPGCVDSGYKDEAVKAGKAEYYLDANHVRRWRWLP